MSDAAAAARAAEAVLPWLKHYRHTTYVFVPPRTVMARVDDVTRIKQAERQQQAFARGQMPR